MNMKQVWDADPEFITEIKPFGDVPGYDPNGSGEIGGKSHYIIERIGGEVTLADGNTLIVDPDGNIIG